MLATGKMTIKISTHAPRTGSDDESASAFCSLWHFNPRSPHGERPDKTLESCKKTYISTHAPRTGSDITMTMNQTAQTIFQPTLPARGATASARTGDRFAPHFNPRSPHGERRMARLEERGRQKFQPTLPARGATLSQESELRQMAISTHAPRTGSDLAAPEEDRPSTLFQPTLPARGATPRTSSMSSLSRISTHAPRTGSDRRGCGLRFSSGCHFNPRSPHGERRTRAEVITASAGNFNPRSPHGERLVR